MQCAAAATTAVGTAAGLRVWLRQKAGEWMTPPRLRAATVALAVLAVLGAGVAFGGT